VVGQFDEAEQPEEVVAVVALVVLAEEEFAERVLEAREETVLVVDEEAVVEEGQLASQVVEVVEFADLQVELQCGIYLQHVLMLAESIYFLQEGLRLHLYRVGGTLSHTEHDLHALVLQIETGEVGPQRYVHTLLHKKPCPLQFPHL
jgi:hypothetical protein